jgi:hypothetical protein
MGLSIIFCNPLARSLVMILIEKFNSEMGQESLVVIGLSFLGMGVMKEEFMLCKLIFP